MELGELLCEPRVMFCVSTHHVTIPELQVPIGILLYMHISAASGVSKAIPILPHMPFNVKRVKPCAW